MSDPAAALDLILKVIEVLGIVVGGVTLFYKLGGAVARFEAIGSQQANEIKELKASIEKVSELITSVAVQSTRLDNLDARMVAMNLRTDELRKEMWFRLETKAKAENEF